MRSPHWSTTFCAVLRTTIGSTLLRENRACGPLNTLLIDSLHFIHKLQVWFDQPHVPGLRTTFIDFIALHTHFTWADVDKAYTYWRSFLLSRLNQNLLGPKEVMFVSWLLSPKKEEDFLPLSGR